MTVLLKMSDDIIKNSISGLVTALVLLDFSKAFHEISHNLLLAVLSFVGFSGDSVVLCIIITSFQKYVC